MQGGRNRKSICGENGEILIKSAVSLIIKVNFLLLINVLWLDKIPTLEEVGGKTLKNSVLCNSSVKVVVFWFWFLFGAGSHCLTIPSAGITGMPQHTWLKF
jgi:hypothetical protein